MRPVPQVMATGPAPFVKDWSSFGRGSYSIVISLSQSHPILIQRVTTASNRSYATSRQIVL